MEIIGGAEAIKLVPASRHAALSPTPHSIEFHYLLRGRRWQQQLLRTGPMGRVTQVIGPVVDVEFAGATCPRSSRRSA
jgi:hypothetical protein